MNKFIVFIAAIFFSFGMFSQANEFPISQGGVVETCSGAFLDSGSAADYSANENFTITFCPEVEGDVIFIDFLTVDINCPNPNNNCDYLEVFDGDNTGANSMGTVTSAITYTASPLNTTGCLTFRFVSNGSGEGAGWAASISCETPCDRPLASAETDPGGDMPILVCVDEEIAFDGSSSTTADGFVMDTWEWDFRDGTIDSLSGPIATHAYQEPGEYIVQLYLVDDNGCASTNRTDIQIWVSTLPNFELMTNTLMCEGGEACQEINPDTLGVEWNALPTVDLGGGVLVQDDVGVTFESTVEFNSFSPGQELNSIDDLENIFINFEHSFMGDLLIQISCPDGTTVNIHEQGGGGTFLGEPVDIDAQPLDPGVGWDYWWADDAPNGTWADEGANYATLPSDTYSTVGDLEDLVGCPLNGVWTLSMTDLWGSDNGFIFEWAVNFDPSLYPELTSFTPIYGMGPDSLWWDGPFISSTSDDLTEICVSPPDAGQYDYTINVVNNFGCAYDSTITVTAIEIPIVNAGEDIFLTCSDAQLNGSIENGMIANCGGTAGAYNYCYTENDNTVFTYCPDNPGDGTALSIILNSGTFENFFDNLIVYDGADTGSPVMATLEGDVSDMVFTSTNSDGCITIQITSDGSVSCNSGSQTELSYEITCSLGSPFITLWEPEILVTNSSVLNPDFVDVIQDTEFTLTAYAIFDENCSASDEVMVFVDAIPDPGENTTVGLCPEFNSIPMVDLLDGTPDPGGVWYDDQQNEVDSVFVEGQTPAGVYTYMFNGCDLFADLDIAVYSIDITTSADTTICIDGTATLEVDAIVLPSTDPIIIWNGGQFEGDSWDVYPSQTVENYTVYAAYGEGCISDAYSIEVSLYDPLILSISEGEIICPGDEVFLQTLVSDGGLEPYNYSWTDNFGNVSGGPELIVNPETDTEFCLTLTDACETPENTQCVWINLDEFVSPVFEADITGDCFPIQVVFSGLADNEEYIESVFWDFGNTHSATTIGTASQSFANPGYYDISYTVYTLGGCVYSSTRENYIHAFPRPDAHFAAEPEVAVLPNTTFDFINYSHDNDLNYWMFSNLDSTYEVEPDFTFPEGTIGTYDVALYVENVWGCTDSTFHRVEVIEDFLIYVPNTFTPDGDGINEYFKIEGIDIDDTHYLIQIFNRWGDRVFESRDLEQVWDGSHQQGDYFVPNGTYTYRIETRSKTTQDEREIVGHVNVIR